MIFQSYLHTLFYTVNTVITTISGNAVLSAFLGLGLVGAVQYPLAADYLQLVHHHDFGDFVDGADAAGEGDEGVAHLHDALFALGHAADADEFGNTLRVDDIVAEEVGDDADDTASILQRGTADDAHKAEITAAIDEGVPLLGDTSAKFSRIGDDSIIVRQRRATEDCYVHCGVLYVAIVRQFSA